MLAVVDVSAVVPIGGCPAGEVEVLLVGDLVAATGGAARRELGQCLDRATRRIVLDLERTRVDACGLPVLADLMAVAASRGVSVELRSAGEEMRSALAPDSPPTGVGAPGGARGPADLHARSRTWHGRRAGGCAASVANP